MIAFIGSPFSPYYRHARDRGRGDARNHCAINVALYGRGHRWAMTERDRHALRASGSSLAIGPSSLAWDRDVLTITIDEVAAPVPARVRGTIRVMPGELLGQSRALDDSGRHRWRVLAPHARVEVALTSPDVHWSGTAYVDTNRGDEPLEDAFTGWHWSRTRLREGTAILYDVSARGGGGRSIALHCGNALEQHEFTAPPLAALPASRWGIARATRADGATARIVRTLVDAPFYSRSLVAACTLGECGTAVHESLSLDRFNCTWVRALLPFRMPRAALHYHG